MCGFSGDPVQFQNMEVALTQGFIRFGAEVEAAEVEAGVRSGGLINGSAEGIRLQVGSVKEDGPPGVGADLDRRDWFARDWNSRAIQGCEIYAGNT